MRILIDECLPSELKETLTAIGHECQTVRQAGFGAKKNGELLSIAEGRWDVLLSSDRNISKTRQDAALLVVSAPLPVRLPASHQLLAQSKNSRNSCDSRFPNSLLHWPAFARHYGQVPALSCH